MTELVAKAIRLSGVIDSAGFDVIRRIRSDDPGQRVMGYALAFARPDPDYIRPLLDAVTIEGQAFAQYWAILALARCLGDDRAMPHLAYARTVLRQLERSIPPSTDRQHELSKILRDIDVRLITPPNSPNER